MTGNCRLWLTGAEITRLTLFKWRYSLTTYGFSDAEAARLLFLKWMVSAGRVRP